MKDAKGEVLVSGTLERPRIELSEWGIRHGKRRLLDGLTLHVSGPGVLVLMGPSGTGKSTVLKALAGMQPAHAEQWGQLLVDGNPPSESTSSLVQQHPRDLAMSVFQCLASPVRQLRPYTPLELRQAVTTEVEQLGLDCLRDHLDTPLVQLPRSLARLTLIARAALAPARVLLLDEPTSDLDPAGTESVIGLIQTLATSRLCVVSLHHQAQARRLASEVALIAGGHIQVHAPTRAFFDNPAQHPVLAQFLRTGSCSLPSLDALPEELEPAEPSNGADGAKENPALGAHAPQAVSATASVQQAPPKVATPAPSASPPHASTPGPNGFHWLTPGQLAGCPMPGVVFPITHDLQLLRNVGVTVLINLTEQPMLEPEIAAFGIRSIHMGVEDRNAPPVMWMKMLLVRIERLLAEGEVVAVHCRAGLGRTGTALASWLISQGLTAEESLRRIRAIEPGFVQSAVQERFLVELEENLLIRVRPH